MKTEAQQARELEFVIALLFVVAMRASGYRAADIRLYTPLYDVTWRNAVRAVYAKGRP